MTHTYTAILYLKIKADSPEVAAVLLDAAAERLKPTETAEVMRVDHGTILQIPDPK